MDSKSTINASEYKKFHESFMQNNEGSTPEHTFAFIFFTVQCTLYAAIKPRLSIGYQYIYEFMVIVVPMIFAYTLFADYIYALNSIAFMFLSFQLIFYLGNASNKFKQKNVFLSERLPLISILRSLTYLMTVLCILAVDFQVFPRYLAKTERFGYSLMDTGVGLFAIVSGLVHKDLRKEGFKVIMRGNVKVVFVLFILGVSRFIAVKLLNYQEHVTEYGVHWNFFFSIAACKLIATLILYFTKQSLFYSCITLALHEYILDSGVEGWVFSNTPRDNFLTANREGICSCLGYVCIYLYGNHIRGILMNRNNTKYQTLKKLAIHPVTLWTLIYFATFFQPTSRVLANGAYCLYMEALLSTISTVLYFVTVLVEDKKKEFRVPLILTHINTNGLSYFIIGNLLTGAINLSIRTLFVPSIVTLFILNVYMFVTLSATMYLKYIGLKV